MAEVLRSLAFPQMLDRRDNIEPCHTNTCHWILELEKYKSWRSQSCGLLWIKGKPGAGKSTLMAFLHDRLKTLRDESQGIRLDFFFTARGTEMQRTPLGMFRSLLNQIFERDTTVRSQVRRTYEQRCRQFGFGELKWEWPRSVLEELLTGAILESAIRQPVNIFVDALDEAGAESAQQLATYFHRLIDRAATKNSAVQICISCRHYPIIGNAQAIEICVEDHNHKDIAAYINDTLADTELDDDPSQGKRELLRQLFQQANMVFQWAHLMMPLVKRKMLEGESFDDIRRWLREIPTGLEDVYTYILSKVIEVANREQSFLLFQWICLAERPLTVTEMRYALTASNARVITGAPRRLENFDGFVESNERMKRRIKTLSGGLTEVVLNGQSDETVQVVHQSVNDFLRAKGLRLLHPHLPGTTSLTDGDKILFQCQATLYRSCMVYLATADLPQMVQTGRSKRKKKIIRNLPFLEYATVNLFIHAEKAAGSRADAVQNELVMLQRVIRGWIQSYHVVARYDIACPAFNGTTLLHIAAATNLVDLIDSMLSNGESNGEDLSREDENGRTAFHLAARWGHIPAGKILLEKGADCEARYGNGITPLVEAASRGNVRFLEWLLHEGASLESTMNKAAGALQVAAVRGQQSVVKLLIGAGAKVNAKGGEFGNALQAAAYEGSTEIVQMLLDAQADVNAQGGIYHNALQAATCEGSTEIVLMLLDAQADVNAQGGPYGNALQAAAYRGSTEIVRALLDAQADVNARGGEYGNALQAAAYRGSTEIVRALLDAQADVNARGGEYGSALQAAAASSQKEPYIVQMLLDAEANVNAQGGKYGNALQAAVYHRSTEIVRMLLDARVDVNARGGLYGSGISAAIYTHHLDMVQNLLNAGADVSLADELGQTPLHVASFMNQLNILNRFPLLASTVNVRDKLSRTPLHLAVHLGHNELALRLLDLGADPNILDGYGRNILDWAQGNHRLTQQIRYHFPQTILTPAETQNMSLRRSVSQTAGLLLHSRLYSPGPLLRQLGRFLLFLGESSNARYLFQLHVLRISRSPTDIWEIQCDICRNAIYGSHFVCKTCAHVDLCRACEPVLLPNQRHQTFEVPDVSEDELEPTGILSEHFRSLLRDLVSEYSAPNSHTMEKESSHDSGSCPPLKRTRLV
ncbi:uncharacterized protein N7503_007742 [Penicillium pulvis]|uniref:uncharacterized protein n=1 Tax=Penicillium pulvis TaxID=1562058 RepID=UPI0025483DAA|nr:uncharacterized protein N7503_007742 [Penicillium pulvis]KAJ5798446.1 hypothetical protein N7503_007742 [Penicillium pulvis]